VVCGWGVGVLTGIYMREYSMRTSGRRYGFESLEEDSRRERGEKYLDAGPLHTVRIFLDE